MNKEEQERILSIDNKQFQAKEIKGGDFVLKQEAKKKDAISIANLLTAADKAKIAKAAQDPNAKVRDGLIGVRDKFQAKIDAQKIEAAKKPQKKIEALDITNGIDFSTFIESGDNLKDRI